MLGPRLSLGKIGGVPVGVDASWVPFAAMVTYALGAEQFPAVMPGLPDVAVWAAAAVAAVGQAGMVLAHEFGHILVARGFGIGSNRVTLFLFGGLAELSGGPPTPKAEILIALAGPAVSALLAGLFWGLWRAAVAAGWAGIDPSPLSPAPGFLSTGLVESGDPWTAAKAAAVCVLGVMLLVNAALALFNLLPGFPMDGGRVLRGFLWAVTGNLPRATRAASAVGVLVGGGIVALGVWGVTGGGGWAAGWPVLMGAAVIAAARWSDARGRFRRAVSGVPVRELMRPVDKLHTVPDRASLQGYFDVAVLELGCPKVPVVDGDGVLLGRLTTRCLAKVPREAWPTTAAADACEPVPDAARVQPSVDAVTALAWMQHARRGRLYVVDGAGKLKGVLSDGDASRAFRAAVDLDVGGPPRN